MGVLSTTEMSTTEASTYRFESAGSLYKRFQPAATSTIGAGGIT